jgi:predicted RNase H-like nuclease (RuvC/YqgF family)
MSDSEDRGYMEQEAYISRLKIENGELRRDNNRMEHSVKNLIDLLEKTQTDIKELEWNNRLLQDEINELRTNPPSNGPDKREELIQMMAPDIERNGQLRGRSQYIYDVYNLYCEIYGKEGNPTATDSATD